MTINGLTAWNGEMPPRDQVRRYGSHIGATVQVQATGSSLYNGYRET